MSEGEIEDLAYLDQSKFDEKQHLALSWVRAAVTSREGPPFELAAAFQTEFDERERRCIVATAQGMFFTNLVTNTLFGRLLRPPGRREEQSACALP